MSYGLTPTQRDLLLILQELLAAGRCPSLRELAWEMDIGGPSRIRDILVALRDRGRIAAWTPGAHRSLRVLDPLPFPPEPEIVGFFDPNREMPG